MSRNLEQIQENEYIFPYHYIPSLANGIPSTMKSLAWGWEYLTYMDFVITKIREVAPKSVLDIGCGDGYLLNKIYAAGIDIHLSGVDCSKRAIAFANAFCKAPEPFFEIKDVFDINKKSEIVTMVEVIEHIPDSIVDSFIQKAFSLASKYVIITVPTTVFEVQAKHYRHYDEDLMDKQTKFSKDAFTLVEQYRLYSNSLFLKFCKRLYNNKYFYISFKFMNKLLWKIHKRFTYFSNQKKGMHLVSIYKRI